ncbi:hypothetical protein PQX77_020700 [Marasmius sp. AFHP31]|nr:hypothetical protein PQX77_020700 [Marasmius sp. AFHP31]
MSPSFDAIVCVDTCFTQKHNKQKRIDPRKYYPKSVFLPEETVKAMVKEVEIKRPQRANKKTSKNSVNSPDGLKGPLRVPTSVLDACKESFTAADKRREKASTQYFNCTGLMGLLCHHDRVLWLVNMHTAGERQHDVLALLDTLFQHLPTTFVVGLLYDIGCQLHRSCIKWGFLEDYLHRLSFAISIFHAFRHRWPCQLVYHPQKAEGFGLSDGEGVAGYHNRLYTLDRQIHHLDKENLDRLGQWVTQKYTQAQQKHKEALVELKKQTMSQEVLQNKWADQVADQTKPLPVQSRNKGEKAVEEVVKLREARHKLEVESIRLTQALADLGTNEYDRLEFTAQLEKNRAIISRTEKALRAKESLLGVDEKAQVQDLIQSPFLRARMNALALKTRLMQRLRSSRFERDRIEWLFRKTQAEKRVHNQVEDSVKRKDPAIVQIAQRYNKLCSEIQDYIDKGQAPGQGVAPKAIPTKGLFALDVNDDIWQDVGLADRENPDQPPLWLSDKNVRAGIKFMLQDDCSWEELLRLQHKHDAMQTWFREEWDLLSLAINNCDDDSVYYMLELHRKELLSICVRWTNDLRGMHPSPGIVEWGLSAEELAAARRFTATDVVELMDRAPDSEGMDESDEEVFEEDDVDAGLYEHMAVLGIDDEVDLAEDVNLL